LSLFVPAFAVAQDPARVVLTAPAGDPAPVGEVAVELARRLEALRVEVEAHEPEGWPETGSKWTELARRLARERPGTLLLAGWRCGERDPSCALVLVEPDQGGVVEISVAPGGEADTRTACIARAIGEALAGGLVSEVRRLASGAGAEADAAPPEAAAEGGAPAPAPEGEAFALRLWVEGGYAGEYPYPGRGPIHGPFLGLSLAPSRWVAPTLTVGWAGIEQGEGPAGEAASHRIPVTLSVRVRFGVGPATLAVAPAGRIDTVFSRVDPAGTGASSSSSVDPEIHVGGIGTWHLPFPGGLEAVVGVGVLATVLGRDTELDGERLIGGSSVRFLWTAALAWDPRTR
jgi:hypothetical protein